MAIYNVEYLNESFLKKRKIEFDLIMYAAKTARELKSKNDEYKSGLFIYNDSRIKKLYEENRYEIAEIDQGYNSTGVSYTMCKQFISDMNDKLHEKNIEAYIGLASVIKIRKLK